MPREEMRSTGATDAQIDAAKDWTGDYLHVLTSTGRAIAAEAVRRTVPPGSVVVGPDALAALRRVVGAYGAAVGHSTPPDRADWVQNGDLDRLDALLGDR